MVVKIIMWYYSIMKTKKTNSPDNQKNASILGIPVKTSTKQKIIRSLISVLGFVGIFGIIFLILHFTGILDKLDTPQDLKELILQGGVWSYLVFMLIQFLQVTILPLPAIITTVAGALVFGPWVTYILSLISVLLGSLFAFYLGKKFGRKIVVWIAGEEDAKKWDEKLSKGKYLFFLMLLFPGFPDDILCMLVGATPMTYRFFMMCNVIARPIVFIPIVFLGGGTIIPYTGWGIPVWIVLIVLSAILFYLSIRYQEQIEIFFENLSKKIKDYFSKKRKNRNK